MYTIADFFGEQLKEGDFVIFPTVKGRNYLTGTVTSIVPRKCGRLYINQKGYIDFVRWVYPCDLIKITKEQYDKA